MLRYTIIAKSEITSRVWGGLAFFCYYDFLRDQEKLVKGGLLLRG